VRNRRAVAAGSVRSKCPRKSLRRFFSREQETARRAQPAENIALHRKRRKLAKEICRFSGLVCRVRAKPRRYETVCRVLRCDQQTPRSEEHTSELQSPD